MPTAELGLVGYPGLMAELGERAERWASTMHGHADGAIAFAHVDSSAGSGSTSLVSREQREEIEGESLAPLATRAIGAGAARDRRGPGPVADVLRARSRPHPARQCVSPAGGQDAGLRVSRRPPTHPTDARPRGRPGGHLGRPCARAQRGTDRGDRSRPRLRPRARRPCQRGRTIAIRAKAATTTRVWGADVTLTPLNLCSETLDGIRNHSWSRPAPRTPEGEIVSWADRIAYVCHDFEDAVAAGIVTPDALPDVVRDRCGERRSLQLGAFITAMIEAAGRTGRVGMTAEATEALAAFRRFNYDNVYLRPASQAQARSVIAMLQALVEHYTKHPQLLPDVGDVDAGSAEATPRRCRIRRRHDRPVRLPSGHRAARLGHRQTAARHRHPSLIGTRSMPR